MQWIQQLLAPSMIHRMGCTPFYKGCGESLEGVDPSMCHRMGSTPFYRGCGELLEGVDPSMIHRTDHQPAVSTHVPYADPQTSSIDC